MNEHIRYVLDPSDAERDRLRVQAELFRPLTQRVLMQVGLAPGMRVLDVGTGTGDIAFMAAEIVGSSGHVLGVDVEQSMVEAAVQTAFSRGFEHVTFETGSLRPGDRAEVFDLVVGRFVLAHQPDPVAFLRNLSALVVPGGSIAFIETAFDLHTHYSNPPMPGFDDMVAKWLAFLEKKIDVTLGSNMVGIFAKAGLGTPVLTADLPAGPFGSDVMEYMVLNLKTMRSALETAELEVPDEITLANDIRDFRRTAELNQAQFFGPCVVAASARIR